MQMEHKEDHEPSYDNITTAIGATMKATKTYDIRQKVTRPAFIWTATATAISLLTIIVVVPTVLEFLNKRAYTVTGETGHHFLIACIPVVEVHNIVQEVVTIQVLSLVEFGVPEMIQKYSNATISHVQYMVTGEAGLSFLAARIPVTEVYTIVSESVIIHIQSMEVIGVLEMPRSYSRVMHTPVQNTDLPSQSEDLLMDQLLEP